MSTIKITITIATRVAATVKTVVTVIPKKGIPASPSQNAALAQKHVYTICGKTPTYDAHTEIPIGTHTVDLHP